MRGASIIDGRQFAAALTSGIHRVIRHQATLNRINVFPVADSDTGTNLALSLGSALPVLKSDAREHLGTMLVRTADALLDGARGNSGAIMAQFFQGVSDAAGELAHFSADSFAAAMRRGSDYARDALSEPREGTILSVIRAFADSIGRYARHEPPLEFPSLLDAAAENTATALAETPQQLAVLQKAGVVDAGAMGFAELVNGVAGYLRDGVVEPLPDDAFLDLDDDFAEATDVEASSQYRFCTECLVVGDDIDRRKLREALGPLGDSLVLAGSKLKAKIHIHSDDPDAVFEAAAAFGELRGQKADDMRQQQHSAHDRSRTFAVITDSGADLPDRLVEEHDVHMVPCRIQFGTRGYLDKVSITTDEFYRELETNLEHPTTSQPAPGDFRRQFQFLASHYADVVSINLTAGASGTFEAARAAAGRVQGGGNVHVIDSQNASTGQGQLVALAGRCAAAGLSATETIRIVERQRSKTRIFALLEDLRYGVRGGRLPAPVATLARWTNTSPILTFKPGGRIGVAGFLFGKARRLEKFARFVARRLPADRPLELMIAHAVAGQRAADLRELLEQELANVDSLDVCDLGTGIGVHGGPGTLVVSALPAISVEQLAGRGD